MRRVIVLALVAALAALADFSDTFPPSPNHPAIRYFEPASDPVARLNAKLADGSEKLAYTERAGYLKSVLDALAIPVESQVMVQSRTSLQAALISPSNPRSIFFNDSVAVGWMYGGMIEVASMDPVKGVIFYTLQQDRTRAPEFRRDNQCLGCHQSDTSLGAPGMIVRNIFPSPDGDPLLIYGTNPVDHRTPLDQRWGGYYVTGSPAGVRHMGNAYVTDRDKPEIVNSIPLTTLTAKFPTDRYLSPYSDAAALLVFDHQMYGLGLITRLGWAARTSPQDERAIDDGARELADYFMFTGEAPLKGKMGGAAGFAARFSAQGPRDSKGRSLRQLNLQTRLFEYPCSYLVYSPAFQALPEPAKNAVYKHLLAGLATKGAPGADATQILHETLRLP